MSRERSEDGFTLIEVLAAAALFIVIMLPIMGALDGFVTRSAATDRQTDAQDQARTAVDRLARELRNLANPTNLDTHSIDRAAPADLVFKTADPAKRRVRYCLGPVQDGAATLWQQNQIFSLAEADPGMPASAVCPAPVTTGGWGTQSAVVPGVVNASRPVFSYTGLGSGGETSTITAIRPELFINADGGTGARETSLGTGAFLRNQNQMPSVADFSLVQSPPGSRTFHMNGSQASDPEGGTLEYRWYQGTGDVAAAPDCQTPVTQSAGGLTCLGRGISLAHTFASGAGARTVTLKVTDPGGLSASHAKQTPVLP
jgi:type II secretory pathway pseudopilin PulG